MTGGGTAQGTTARGYGLWSREGEEQTTESQLREGKQIAWGINRKEKIEGHFIYFYDKLFTKGSAPLRLRLVVTDW